MNDPTAARAELVRLLGRVAQGDRAALDELYRRTSRKLFGIALRILDDRKEAEDALQETYLTIWRQAGRFDAERASPISWVAVIARNRAVDRLRIGVVRSRAVAVEQAEPLADDTPDAESALLATERSARIGECLRRLADDQRRAIRHAFFEGRTYAAQAEELAIPLSTMKSRVRRGLARLKACLDHDDA